MKRSFKQLFVSLLVLTLMVSIFPGKSAQAEENDFLNINAKAAILIEFNTGKIIYQKNVDEALPVASMTKMMTEYLLLEAIEAGKLDWSKEVILSDYAQAISQKYPELSNVPMRKQEPYTIKELYEAMAIYSANGATIALAEAIAGSETKFVEMMNAKAEEIGLENYNFVNSTGLNNEDLAVGGVPMHPEGTDANEETTLSAKDTAKLAHRLLTDYPEILDTASIPFKVFREGTPDAIDMPNWNKMLFTEELKVQFEGIDGLKTGSTDAAGFNFTGTAERDGMRVISVVMNTTNDEGVSTEISRFIETKKLMTHAFGSYSVQELFPGEYQIEGESILPVTKGKEDSVEIQTKEPFKTLVKDGNKDNFKPQFEINEKLLNEEGELTAPVKEGDSVGVMTVTQEGGQDYGYLFGNDQEGSTVELVTKEGVEKANWFVLSMRAVGGFFSDLWSTVAGAIKGLF
ncbi:D-alanyl-D-alanine carboxypeptidase family protein [Sutcliffiella horikoshii]|uniref:serine-type D-Ala-D-Ala carboxypeptidase n=1 Tax=Sutcliffiella horikoshii TaxID=79883 RepID=A0A1Y0CGZ9_9BACI|nr:D-alanyl-D-alanine carboxypeptidase family protein [Sutcliffiella horikoshii]ART74569.1 D-alanyl-D-alanine carboxypeptidase [Sutcliffiella horikoshii]TYS53608.1 D-alanyl-D-alanine carboxypeptidase [Sutcliffiella horikoshii]